MNKNMTLIETIGSKLAQLKEDSHGLTNLPSYMSIHCNQLLNSSPSELQAHIGGSSSYTVGLHTLYKVRHLGVPGKRNKRELGKEVVC
jgi:hypothetical protein